MNSLSIQPRPHAPVLMKNPAFYVHTQRRLHSKWLALKRPRICDLKPRVILVTDEVISILPVRDLALGLPVH